MFELQDMNGRTPLHIAAIKDHDKIFELLLSYSDAELWTTDTSLRYPIHLACGSRCIKVLKFMIENKVCNDEKYLNAWIPRGKKHLNRTPLVFAIENRKVDCVKLLCDQENVDIVSGKRSLRCAVLRRDATIYDILFTKLQERQHFQSGKPVVRSICEHNKNEMKVKEWIFQMTMIKNSSLHTKYAPWMKILQSIYKLCVGNTDIDDNLNNKNEKSQLILSKHDYFGNNTSKSHQRKMARPKLPRWRGAVAARRNNEDFRMSQIQQPRCLECNHSMHTIETTWSNTTNTNSIDATISCDQFHHHFHNSALFNLRFSRFQNCSFQNGNFTNCLRM